ncbi:RDD family protein [Streptomyces gobiensis]|uniref:RDD family protein n=1 Tax=Streptomyces gobiensis TaxID=2875706 RepID=UPI001E2B6BFD|nr:RDD family protein [Streptomyces gobiensis]UGY91664.1 RDD family protein [Streptomyces gobiensis]
MSAPPSGSANGSTPAGYYPDPSIPGYMRYWDGAAWVPGTSRPEPREGEPMPEPPPGVPKPPPAREETGPVFLDEEPADEEPADEDASAASAAAAASAGSAPSSGVALPAPRPHGNRPEPASAWHADASRQGGFGGQQDRRVSWGAEEGHNDGDPRGGWQRTADSETAASADSPASGDSSASAASAAGGDSTGGGERQPAADGTFTFRAVKPEEPERRAEDTARLRRADIAEVRAARAAQQRATPAASPSWAQQVHDLAHPAQAPAQNPAPAPAQSPTPPAAQPAPPAQPAIPAQPQAPGPAPVAPWKPPVNDPFLQAAQAQARPAGLGRRLVARLIDGIVVSAVGAAAALPLLPKATDHIQAKVAAAEQAGVTREIWLIDSTTGAYLAMVLGAILFFGVLYEALPTARWGRTLGKKLCGVRVLDMEQQTPPGFGSALLRWLLYGVLAVAVLGVLNVAWCLFDKPWRQCWHDKAARTFVAGQ